MVGQFGLFSALPISAGQGNIHSWTNFFNGKKTISPKPPAHISLHLMCPCIWLVPQGRGGIKAEIAGPTPKASDSVGLVGLRRGPRICMASLSTSHPGEAWLPTLKGTAGSELPVGKPRTRLVWVSLLQPTSRLRLPVARPSVPNSFCS